MRMGACDRCQHNSIYIPNVSTATPIGMKKLAAVPVPSALPLVVDPAKVVTTPITHTNIYTYISS